MPPFTSTLKMNAACMPVIHAVRNKTNILSLLCYCEVRLWAVNIEKGKKGAVLMTLRR